MNTRKTQEKELIFDREIERTARRNRKATAQRLLTDFTSTFPSTPPSPGLGSLLVPPPSVHLDSNIEEEQVPPINTMAEDPKPLKSSFVPQGVAQPSCITFTPADGTTFSLSPQLINSVPHFYGKPNEDQTTI